MQFPRPVWPSRRHFGKTAIASSLFVFVTLILALRFLVVPNIQRLHLRVFGLSSFDYGFRGLYPTRKYYSFEYESPDIEVAKWDSRCSEDYTFLAPHGDAVKDPGAMILDAQGNLVWKMKPQSEKIQDFRVQEYQGKQYLTYWHGVSQGGHGHGAWTMLDASYTPRFEISAVGAFDGDMHDFQITENGTALFIVYDIQPTDLSEIDGPEYGYISDCLFQEINVATGDLIFEWRMSEHVPLNASYEELKNRGWASTEAFDVFHLNSIHKDSMGNYLISARHTHSIMSVDSQTGDVIWTLGGKMNEFVDTSEGRATDFGWQHDARWQDANTISLFDNAAEEFMDDPVQSRGLILSIDVPNRFVAVRAEYNHPEGVRATSQGNMQVLSELDNVMVAWGSSAAFTEFSADGEMLCDTHFAPSNWFQLGKAVSYRIAKGSWVGKPNTNPEAVIVSKALFVSWNGATEVHSWRLETWDGKDMTNMNFLTADVVRNDGFETFIAIPYSVPNVYLRVVALDKNNVVLGTSAVLDHQLRWGMQKLFHHYLPSISVSAGVVISAIMVVCCILLGVRWVWKTCQGKIFKESGYTPVPLEFKEVNVETVDIETSSWSRASFSSVDQLPMVQVTS
ncbi:uncharacterized protein N7483_011091 [Penicillium malachiteum]|uniref:uncharacterized protein n=1 Tax=Penicillium malachiteum TaxID=1324776 RepID=UPI00254876AF|nr:uncharacterized protein N7483_011091 [Penicillium malachiteum]KAJ5713910.1 hypothetical protein N7483_011091 [Penicillium malachiteum]